MNTQLYLVLWPHPQYRPRTYIESLEKFFEHLAPVCRGINPNLKAMGLWRMKMMHELKQLTRWQDKPDSNPRTEPRLSVRVERPTYRLLDSRDIQSHNSGRRIVAAWPAPAERQYRKLGGLLCH